MSIAQVINPKVHDLAGISIRRLLPTRSRMMVGPFIFMDQGGPMVLPSTARGIPEHPHAGLSTFTYLIEGSMRHEDSAGNKGLVRSGDIALMTAGSGITHAEQPVADESGEANLFFVQMWLALPDEHEEMDPAFEHFAKSSLPLFSRGGATARLAMGSMWGETAPTTCYASSLFAELHLEPGAELSIPPQYGELALMLLAGEGSVGEQELRQHHLNVLSSTEVKLRSEKGGHFALLGGDKFPSKRYIGGNFVASSSEKLSRWMRDASGGSWPRIGG